MILDIIAVVEVVLGMFLVVQPKLDSNYGVLVVVQIKDLAAVDIHHLDLLEHMHL